MALGRKRLLVLLAWLCVTTLSGAARAQTLSYFLYLLTDPPSAANSVVAWRVAGDGSLVQLAGSPFSTGGNGLAPVAGSEYAHGLAVSPSRNLLFAANEQQGSIAVFNMNPWTGLLRVVPGSPFVVPAWVGRPGTSLTVSSDGQVLYGSNVSVISFRVESNGALTPMGASWAFSSRINGTTVTEANDKLYLAMSDRVTVLKTGTTGITSQPPTNLQLGNVPTDVAVSRAGDLLYVGSRDGGIQAFNTTGGGFSPVAGTPFFGLTTHLSGLVTDFYERVLVAHGNSVPRVTVAVVGPGGGLSAGPGSPHTPSFAPTGGTLAPDGKTLFLSGAGAQVDAWTIGETGALSHVPSFPVFSGAPSGHSKLVAFPEKPPTPAPALPHGALLLLAFCLAAVVWVRSSSATVAANRSS